MKLISLITTLLLLTMTVYSQHIKRQETILVVNPDTAVINVKWQKNIELVQADFRDEYAYREAKREMLSSSRGPLPDSVKEKKEKLFFDKNTGIMSGVDIHHFKYYDIFSFKVAEALDAELNTRAPYSAVRETTSKGTDIIAIQALATQLNADYIVYFKNIHTGSDTRTPELIFTLVLYSSRENKVVLSKQMTAQAAEADGKISSNNMLSCLISHAAALSVRELIPKLK